MENRFAGQVVWVTGAGAGIGYSHAKRFAAEGASVLCLDINADSAESVAAEIRAAGGDAVGVRADVTSWEQMEAAAARGAEVFGSVRVVVSNAGISADRSNGVEHTPSETWEHIVAVCLTGAFHTAKAALPQLREGGGGSIIFTSSTFGVCGVPEFPCYVAAKHGVIGLMRALANEVADHGIRVNTVCPGTTDTPALVAEARSLGISPDELVESEVATHLFKRLVQPDEISDAVMWLCSDAAGMVTGVELPVDGGYLVRRKLREEPAQSAR